MTVQPRDRSVSIAASPAADGAEPPDWPNTRVPVAMPDVTSDTRMLSMLVCVRAVLKNALVKFPPWILSNSPAGIVVRLEQPSQARLKLIPADVSIRGKDVRLEQPNQARKKLVPADVSIRGKLVRLVQSLQVLLKLVPADVSIRGKLVRPVQAYQALLKLVPEDVLIRGKLVRFLQPYQASSNSVPADVSISGKLVISAHSRQNLVKLVTAP